MAPFHKTLNFSYENLGKESRLIFVFDGGNYTGHTLYKDCFPVVWQDVVLQADGKHTFSTTFNGQYAFATCHLEQGRVVLDSSWERATVRDEFVEGHNKTDTAQNMALCSERAFAMPKPLLYFEDIGPHVTLKVKFTRRLRIYIVDELQESMILRHEIPSPILWDHDFYQPGLAEHWVITYSKVTGRYEIKEAE